MSIPAPTNLRCEYLSNPLGIDVLSPRCSWSLEHPRRGQCQTAYQIVVSSSEQLAGEENGDYWDSGKVSSEKIVNVPYKGKSLESGRRYYWRVRWWDKSKRPSPFSEIAFFEMGLLGQEDWQAKWISMKDGKEFKTRGPAHLGEEMAENIHAHTIYLRKEFEATGEIRQARIYVCGIGLYELTINGKKVGDRVLDPAQTDYRKIALYSTYDITDCLREKNAIGVILGNGRHIKNFGYKHPRLILQARIIYENGKEQIVCSDDTWRTSYGPLMQDGLYYGERYDARLEMPGWDAPGFDDSTWKNAVVVEGTTLASQMNPAIRVTATIKPKWLYSPSSGAYIYDFGQNFSGWARLRVCGPRGSRVTLRYAELAHEDGTLNAATNILAEALNTYVLKGEGTEVYEPRFTYHGFRYVEVTGFPGVPTLENLEGCFVHTDVQKAGDFYCSNELINRIHRNVIWGQLSNLMGIPTDCPQRDERQGWMGDAHLTAEELMFNFDMAAFYTKFLRDIRLAQADDGSLPDVVPPYLKLTYPADPAWGAAYSILLWYMYSFYDDTCILEENYEPLKRYVEFLQQNSDGHIVKKLGKYGDWCPPGSILPKKTTLPFTSTWYYYQDTLLLSKMATVLGKDEDAEFYMDQAENIQVAFNREFLEEDRYGAHTMSHIDQSTNQTTNVLPLYLNMVPEEKRERVVEKLLHDIINDHDYHLDTGILGTRYILDVLTENGHADVAYKLATRDTYPSWGYMIKEGATTLWERWENIASGGMNSHNHIMLGSVDAWFYKTVAGISSQSPGWKDILVKPHVFADLTFATAKLNTIRGHVEVSWQRSNDVFEMTLRIPVGAKAEVHIPLLWEGAVVKEGETVMWQKGTRKETFAAGVSFERVEPEHVVLRVGSGYYVFKEEQG